MFKNQRYIYFYNVRTRTTARGFKELKPFPHYELAAAVNDRFKKGLAESVHKTSLRALYVTDMRVESTHAEILVGFSDPIAADPTLHDRPARTRRTIIKEGAEGVEHSAHIVWHYKNQANIETCDFFLEGAIHLSGRKIAKFLTEILRAASRDDDKFPIDDPEGRKDGDGNYKKLKGRPVVELFGHPSDAFLADLREGKLSELELYTEKGKAHKWDQNGHLIEERQGVLLRPNPKSFGKPLTSIKSALAGNNKRTYEKARVKFNTRTDVEKNVRFFSSDFSLIDEKGYVKKEVVNLAGSLPNAFDRFYEPILRDIRKLAGL